MTNLQLINLMIEKLNKANQNPKIAHWIFNDVYKLNNLNEMQSILNSDANFYDLCMKKLDDYLSNMPFSRITNKSSFYKLEFDVLQNVFSPRNETELLCYNVVQILNNNLINSSINLLDMCCGTGVIGLSIKFHSLQQINLTSIDINPDAIKNTQLNANKLNLLANVIHSNLFSNLDFINKFDVIVCNPPYIDNNYDLLGVDKYDPHNALFANNHGYEIYEKIISSLPYYLKDINKYLIVFEIGINQEEQIIKLLYDFDCAINIKIYKDYNNINRIIVAYKNYEVQDLFL